MCSKIGTEIYIAMPTLPDLADWEEIKICKKCARREVGGKNKKEWSRIHKEVVSS